MAEPSEEIKEFLVESAELLDVAERNLLALEKTGPEKNSIAQIFRAVHSVKGTCGFFGFTKLAAVAHAGENLLSAVRDGRMFPTPPIVGALLELIDVIRRMLGEIEASGSDGENAHPELVAKLTGLLEAGPQQPTSSPPAPVAASAPPPPAVDPHQTLPGAPPPTPVEAPPVAPAPPAVSAAPPPPAPSTPSAEAAPERAAESSIRVDVGLLDHLMNLVGELVLARNQAVQSVVAREDPGFVAAAQRLNLVTTELQEGVMKARMQPLGNILTKVPRLVRDLTVANGKRVRVVMEGTETELDKSLIEAIKDPLTHIVRNAVDHGLESSSDRQARGKDPEGCLRIRAYHEGGQVHLEIADDGRGIDTERVRKKAVERSLITADQAGHMSEREVINLIFLPGFSTAEKVTNVSGRGVGMDVVKTNIDKIGGTIEIQTALGQGTIFKIRIPLTLTIIPAVIISCADERFAIPQSSLAEVLRLEGEQRLEKVHDTTVFRLRGSLLPIVYLREQLGFHAEEAAGGGSTVIVVLQADGRQYGLVVDEIEDTQEIVVKPMEKRLNEVTVFSGSTIMGDGKVALILDAIGLAQRARVLSEVRDRTHTETAVHAGGSIELTEALILVRSRDGGRKAIPLAVVDRLEEFPRAELEWTGERAVMQYRGKIMPLIRLAELLPERRSQVRDEPHEEALDETTVQVVVYVRNGRNIGLVFDQILDVIEERQVAKQPPSRSGVLFNMVIGERITEVLDVETLIGQALPVDGGVAEGVA